MIDQNTTISQQLTYGTEWFESHQGSRLSRRSKLLPLCRPIVSEAEGANFPQLKRVIAVAGDKVVMEPTLDEALSALFGTAPKQAAIKKASSPERRAYRHEEEP